MKLLRFVFIASCLLVCTEIHGQTQCDFEFDYKVQVSRPRESYAIVLKLIKGSDSKPFKVTLYDLISGKSVQEKTISYRKNEEKISFTEVRPSRYTVYVQTQECEEPRSVGGISGIKTFGL